MSQDVHVDSVAKFVASVCQLKDKYPLISERLFSQELLFSGQSNKEYELLPSIARGRDFATD